MPERLDRVGTGHEIAVRREKLPVGRVEPRQRRRIALVAGCYEALVGGLNLGSYVSCCYPSLTPFVGRRQTPWAVWNFSGFFFVIALLDCEAG